jgi:hypothetical protein
MASDHMATPAIPPANMTAPRESGGATSSPVAGSTVAGPESFFLRTSYVAK